MSTPISPKATKSSSFPAKLSIELDRSDKIYYPGETVTGTVTLQVDTTTTCAGGVFLDFSGKASTSWTIPIDDMNNDTKSTASKDKDESPIQTKTFSGETIFHHEIRTLYGKSYQTGALRTTGLKEGTLNEVIDYDAIPNTGTIHIPCYKYKLDDMKFKIEANTGGETVVPLDKLVILHDEDEKAPNFDRAKSVRNLNSTSREKQSFFLTTRVGNMQKGSVVLSAKVAKYETIYPNQAVGIENDYDVVLILQVHKLRGVKRGTKDVQITVHDWTDLPETIRFDKDLHNSVTLLQTSKKHLFKYPFSFRLRNDVPGSASWKIGTDIATISYTLRTYLDIQNKYCVDGTQFTVIANRPIPRVSLLSPYRMETGDQPLHNTFSCCLPGKRVKYTVSMKLNIARLVYSVGELVDLTGSTVINNSKLPQRVQVVLKTFIQQDGGYNQKHTMSKDNILFETLIPEKKSIILTNLPDYEGIRIPNIYPSYAGLFLDVTQTQRCNTCIKWSYTLEIRLPDWGNCGFYCRTPILISCVPPYTNQLQHYRKKKADPVLTSPFSIFEYAVSGINNSTVKEDGVDSTVAAPTLLTKQDDKGRKVVSIEGVPAWMGGRDDYIKFMGNDVNRNRYNEWIDQHKTNTSSSIDASFVDLEKLFYRNIVNAYAGPSGSFDEALT